MLGNGGEEMERPKKEGERSAWIPLYRYLSYQSPPSSLQSKLHSHHVPKPVRQHLT